MAKSGGRKIVAENRKAKFDYFIEERFEAGIALTGAEVKSAKLGHINVADSFCFFSRGELWLKNCLISAYEKSSFFPPDVRRDRKLLLHKREINRLLGKVKEKGFTLVPLLAYFSGSLMKVELGLCKGKHSYDKKQTLRERDIMRQAERDIKNYS